MATSKTETQEAETEAAPKVVTEAVVPKGLRYLVAYPTGISVMWETAPASAGQPATHEEAVVPRGRYLDEFVPAEVAAAKGPFLQSVGHVRAVSPTA